MNSKIKLLIVDDSAFMRSALTKILSDDPEIEIIDYAVNGIECIEKVQKLKPDIVTLDVEMPKMNGIEALKVIMKENPTRVIMVSSLTIEGAQITLEALDNGAVDFIAKPGSFVAINIGDIKKDLISKIKQSVKIPIFNLMRYKTTSSIVDDKISKYVQVKAKQLRSSKSLKYNIVGIATSTGGPPALNKVITNLPEDFPVGVVVVQHMPPGFTKPLADRLNSLSKVVVKEAETGDIIKPGLVLIGKAGTQYGFKKKGNDIEIILMPKVETELFNPSADIMMSEIAEFYGGASVGVIMTGMGKDGSVGLKRMKERGSYNIAESEETAVVFGMPKVAIEVGAIDKVVPLHSIIPELIKLFY